MERDKRLYNSFAICFLLRLGKQKENKRKKEKRSERRKKRRRESCAFFFSTSVCEGTPTGEGTEKTA
jgi:hypothetical protein